MLASSTAGQATLQPLRARAAKRLGVSRLATAALCCSVALIAGCSVVNTPQSVAGVRSLYRSIGIDASNNNFDDICKSFMDEQLRRELEPVSKNCFTPAFEHWAEKVRLSKIEPETRIVISGHEALIYDGVEPERAHYAAGQWQLAAVPEIVPPRRHA